MRIEHGTDAGNEVGAAIAGAVIVLVGPCGHCEYPAAVQIENRRDLPAVDYFLDDFVLAVEVVDVPCAGHRGVATNVGTHIAFFFPESSTGGAQIIVVGGKGSAKVAGILRCRISIRVRLEAIDSVAPDIETADVEVTGELLVRRDLKGVVTGCQV